MPPGGYATPEGVPPKQLLLALGVWSACRAAPVTHRAPRYAKMAEDFELMLHKPSQDTRVGITLVDTTGTADADFPRIMNIIPDAVAGRSGKVKKGDLLMSVNGKEVKTHTEAAMSLREAVGDLKLQIRRPPAKGSLSNRVIGMFSNRGRSSSNPGSPAANTPVKAAQNPLAAAPPPAAASEAPKPDAGTDADRAAAAAKLQARGRGQLTRQNTRDAKTMNGGAAPAAENPWMRCLKCCQQKAA